MTVAAPDPSTTTVTLVVARSPDPPDELGDMLVYVPAVLDPSAPLGDPNDNALPVLTVANCLIPLLSVGES